MGMMSSIMEGALDERKTMLSNFSFGISPRIISFAVCSSLLAVSGSLVGQGRAAPAISVEQTAQGFTAKIGSETLHVTVCGDDVIHAVAGPGDPAASSPVEPWMLDASQSCPGAKFQFAQDDKSASVTTAALKIEFSLKKGNLTYKDSQG